MGIVIRSAPELNPEDQRTVSTLMDRRLTEEEARSLVGSHPELAKKLTRLLPLAEDKVLMIRTRL